LARKPAQAGRGSAKEMACHYKLTTKRAGIGGRDDRDAAPSGVAALT